MKPQGRYRVLLKCIDCDKVFNGTKPIDYTEAIKYFQSTLVNCKDVCPNEKCKKPLTPEIQDMEKPNG